MKMNKVGSLSETECNRSGLCQNKMNKVGSLSERGRVSVSGEMEELPLPQVEVAISTFPMIIGYETEKSEKSLREYRAYARDLLVL
jgi:hypothetical protein